MLEKYCVFKSLFWKGKVSVLLPELVLRDYAHCCVKLPGFEWNLSPAMDRVAIGVVNVRGVGAEARHDDCASQRHQSYFLVFK